MGRVLGRGVVARVQGSPGRGCGCGGVAEMGSVQQGWGGVQSRTAHCWKDNGGFDLCPAVTRLHRSGGERGRQSWA